jgi:hypothetical protein
MWVDRQAGRQVSRVTAVKQGADLLGGGEEGIKAGLDVLRAQGDEVVDA